MTYKVKVTEVLVKTIEVEAASQEEARSKAEQMYDNDEIEFTYPDHHDSHDVEVLDGWWW